MIKGTTERSEVELKVSLLGLDSFNHDMCFKKQIYGITVFYLISMVFDFIMYKLGEDVIQSKDIICMNDTYLIVSNEIGGVYMICESLSIMFYSLFMLQIFYRLPVKYKIVAFSKRGVKKINTQESKLIVNSDMTKQD